MTGTQLHSQYHTSACCVEAHVDVNVVYVVNISGPNDLRVHTVLGGEAILLVLNL